MTVPQIVDIILTVLVLAVGAISAYKAAGKTIYSKVTYLISEAAKSDKTGAEKMSYVVGELYKYVPPIFKKYLSAEKIESIAQSAYDNMKIFAKTEIDEYKAKKKTKKE